MALTDMFAGGTLAGLLVGLGLFALILVLGIYIFASLALMAIAKKTRTPNAWMAWIPIANFYLITQMAGVSGIWTLVLLAMFVPLGNLLILGATIWMFWRIAEEIDMPGWTSLLLILPIINLVILGIYAWKE